MANEISILLFCEGWQILVL